MRVLTLLTCLTLGSIASTASAQFTLFGQDVETTLTVPGWIPGVWFPGLDGTVTNRGDQQDLDTTIGDAFEAVEPLLESIDFILMGQAEFRVGDWIVRGGLLTIDLSGNKELAGGLVEIDGEFELDYIMGEVGYRLGEFSLNEIVTELPPLTLTTDVFVGLRYTRIAGGLSIRGAASAGDSTNWVDAALGGRVHVASSTPSPLSLTLESHIAGFGSDFTWDAKGLVNYQLGKFFEVALGWKALSVDYSDTLSGGKFAIDEFMHGPVIEFSLGF